MAQPADVESFDADALDARSVDDLLLRPGSTAPASGPAVPGSQRIASATYGVASAGTVRVPTLVRTSLSDGRCANPSGIRTVNVLPSPGVLDTSTTPPCIRTSCWTSDSPSPLPSWERARVSRTRWNRWKIFSVRSGGIPAPVSETRSTACSPDTSSATEMPPSWVNLTALLSRLRTIFSHMSRSTQTGRSVGGHCTSRCSPARFTTGANAAASSSVVVPSSVGANIPSDRPEFKLDASSRPLTSLSIRWAFRWASSTSSRTAGSSWSRKRSSGPSTSVSGVRNSSPSAA